MDVGCQIQSYYSYVASGVDENDSICVLVGTDNGTRRQRPHEGVAKCMLHLKGMLPYGLVKKGEIALTGDAEYRESCV